MTTKNLARKALQEMHDAFNAIPDDDSNDFDHTLHNDFAEAMEASLRSFREAAASSIEAKMREEAAAWARTLPDNQ